MPEPGWWLTQGALYALLVISSVALGRRIRFAGAVALGLVVVAVVLVAALPGEDCGGEPLERDPDSARSACSRSSPAWPAAGSAPAR